MVVSTVTDLLYWSFALGATISGFMVISSTNPVHSIFSLVLVFANSSALLLMIGRDASAEFLALLFIIVYVGAIAILFLFVVMMLNIKMVEIADNASRYVPIGVIIGFIFLVDVYDALGATRANWARVANPPEGAAPAEGGGIVAFGPAGSSLGGPEGAIGFAANVPTNAAAIGQVLFSNSAMPYVIIASFVLFVAMIGAIVLTLSHEKGIKRQDIFAQIASRTTPILHNN